MILAFILWAIVLDFALILTEFDTELAWLELALGLRFLGNLAHFAMGYAWAEGSRASATKGRSPWPEGPFAIGKPGPWPGSAFG